MKEIVSLKAIISQSDMPSKLSNIHPLTWGFVSNLTLIVLEDLCYYSHCLLW